MQLVVHVMLLVIAVVDHQSDIWRFYRDQIVGLLVGGFGFAVVCWFLVCDVAGLFFRISTLCGAVVVKTLFLRVSS